MNKRRSLHNLCLHLPKTQSEMVELEVLSRSEHKHNLSLSLFSVGHSGQQCRSCWSELFKTFHLIGGTCIASGSGFFVYVLRSLFSNLVLLAYCPVWFVLWVPPAKLLFIIHPASNEWVNKRIAPSMANASPTKSFSPQDAHHDTPVMDLPMYLSRHLAMGALF